jgi:hypothetical protein
LSSGSQPPDREDGKAARRAQNKAAFAAGTVLPRWACGERPSSRARTVTPPAAVQETSTQLEAERAAHEAQNETAWKTGQHLPRWEDGPNPGRPGPRTGPGPFTTGAQERAAARQARRKSNQAAWANRTIAAADQRALAREQERVERRAADRARAAAWHEDQRLDAELAGSDHDVLWAGDYAATRD